MAENNYWSTTGDQGTIKISEDVVASIAALAAAETDGVSALYSSLTSDIVSFLGKKNLSKGVKVSFEGDSVAVEIGFLASFGCNIREVAKNVQEAVKSSIESMTGLAVSGVNIYVGGIAFAPAAEEEPGAAPAVPEE
ncbi:Asp23/Gls24 family envelope stress response protein [Intestinibacillus massiliensis]|uniref:Asp23/Gls24 family envelope stress response protein n=1 Tax=Intestinibacillus massiliensis TaxID=1871029 RepID=UPI000B35D15A|nr:Asp23/Gls24 family envelope stress response protein [Intestinibacillus massiliensis]MCB6364609.1 Asp23/Gls24 family envelope stress response protein [Intestinibacillus massiliensis]